MTGAPGRLRRWFGGEGPADGEQRAQMLERLRQGGVHDERVLLAMAAVARQEFVTEGFEGAAYADRALSIGYGQTISQPLMVAVLVEALELTEGAHVLDVGTGSGYQAAVMAACGARVASIERIERLAVAARRRFARLGLPIEVVVGDGSLGLPDHAPFDAIAVGAAAPSIPPRLAAQLGEGGRLVVPVTRGTEGEELIRVRRLGDAFVEERLGPCRFVPLIGVDAYPEAG